jgi:hypothetical protein
LAILKRTVCKLKIRSISLCFPNLQCSVHYSSTRQGFRKRCP